MRFPRNNDSLYLLYINIKPIPNPIYQMSDFIVFIPVYTNAEHNYFLEKTFFFM